MPVIVGGTITAPPPTPPGTSTPVVPRTGLRMTWTGWDGSTWDLASGAQGVRLVQGAVRGMGALNPQQFRSEAPGVAGSHYRGTHYQSREVFWPLLVDAADDTPQDWVDLDDTFWRTLDPAKLGVWTVTQPNGITRSLDLRFESAEDGYEVDPVFRGLAAYGVTLVADQPFWRGDPITRIFSVEPPVPFFGPPGIINISSGSSTDTANITNPGDEPGWIVWTLRGPVDTGSSVGFVGAQIPISFSLTEGEVVSIWTKPDQMIAIDGSGAERALGAAAKFQAIPARHTSKLLVTLIAALPGGTIEAELTPYYRRAIGRASL